MDKSREERATSFTGKPVIMIFPFSYLSHYLRCIVLARELKADYEVLFLDDPSYNKFLRKHDLSTFNCNNWEGRAILGKLKNFDFSWLNEKMLEINFQARKSAIEKYGPLVVIGDNDPALKMAAEATGVYYISVLNGYMSKYYSGRRTLSKSHPTYAWMKWVPKGLRDRLVAFGEQLSLRAVHRPFNIVRKKYNLPSYSNYLDELEGDFNIVCDPPDLFPQLQLPDNYVQKEPLVYDEHDVPPANYLLDPAKKTLLVNMGSTGDWSQLAFLHDPFYRRYNIVTAGDEQNFLGKVRTINFPFIAAAAILPFTDLVICHGGNGTIHLCRKYRVPILCRTAYFEQEWNADAVERAKWGRSLDGISDRVKLQQIIGEWMDKKASLINDPILLCRS